MSQPIYVRHRSGIGAQYAVFREDSECWVVLTPKTYWLPKGEYVPCDAPVQVERWEDVTSQCEPDGLRIATPGKFYHEYIDNAYLFSGTKYRLRKVSTRVVKEGMVFIVERQVLT